MPDDVSTYLLWLFSDLLSILDAFGKVFSQLNPATIGGCIALAFALGYAVAAYRARNISDRAQADSLMGTDLNTHELDVLDERVKTAAAHDRVISGHMLAGILCFGFAALLFGVHAHILMSGTVANMQETYSANDILFYDAAPNWELTITTYTDPYLKVVRDLLFLVAGVMAVLRITLQWTSNQYQFVTVREHITSFWRDITPERKPRVVVIPDEIYVGEEA